MFMLDTCICLEISETFQCHTSVRGFVDKVHGIDFIPANFIYFALKLSKTFSMSFPWLMIGEDAGRGHGVKLTPVHYIWGGLNTASNSIIPLEGRMAIHLPIEFC